MSGVSRVYAVVLAIVLMSGVASATTHTVCASGCDYTTIQAAVTAASSYDTVYVYNGTYTENVYITTSHLTILGEGRDVVTVQAGNPSVEVFCIGADWGHIDGFTVTGAAGRGGILIEFANHTRICNNSVSSNLHGILLYPSANNNTIISNVVSGNSENGIVLSENCNNNTIISNIVSGNSANGIKVYQSSDNRLIANSVDDYSGSYHDYSFESTSSNNTIRDPATTENYISLDNTAEILIENTDSSVFSENSGANAKAYPNGNFSLHQSGVSEVIHIVQRDMSILPTNILTITSIPTWSTSGNRKKQWNITGTAGTFAYTMGDMLPDAEANISTDAGWNKTHTANVAGYVTGTYDGGWSDQNFTIISVVGGIRTETKIPMALFIALTILMFFSTGYIFYAKTHISRVFTTLIAAWMAFMLSQMIVSGNVVRMVSALDSGDTWVHDTVAIQIPGLSYLLLFIGVILSIFLVKFVIDFGLEVLREAQREEM